MFLVDFQCIPDRSIEKLKRGNLMDLPLKNSSRMINSQTTNVTDSGCSNDFLDNRKTNPYRELILGILVNYRELSANYESTFLA